MPTRLPLEIQTSLAGYWSYARPGMSVELLRHLTDNSVPVETVRDWVELVRHIPAEMLRPAAPPPEHWHQLLARHCDGQVGHYALNWRVEHHLLARQGPQAAAALTDFAYLYARLRRLGQQQARLLWRETRAALRLLAESPLREELAVWEKFWRGRQFVIDAPAEPFRAELLFLSLADAYAEGSPVSRAAEEWLQHKGPAQPWLRQRFRPQAAYAEPLILELPEEDRPSQKSHSHSDWIESILLGADGRRAVTLTHYGAVRLWDVESGESLGRLVGPDSSHRGMALSQDGQRLAVKEGQRVDVWDLDSLRVVQQIPANLDGQTMAISGSRLYGYGYHGTQKMHIWDLESGRQLAFLPVIPKRPEQLAACADGSRLTALIERRVSGWNLDCHRLLAYHPNHKTPWGWVWADGRVQVIPAGRWPLQLSRSRTALADSLEDIEEWCDDGHYAVIQVKGNWRCWDLHQSSQLASWGLPEWQGKLTLDPQGEAILRAGFAGAPVLAKVGPASQVRVDGEQRRALSWKGDDLFLFDVEEGRLEASLFGHQSLVRQAAISSDGQWAASVADDATMRIWELPAGRCVRVVGTEAVSIAIHADGSTAVSGGADGKVRRWDLGEGIVTGQWQAHDSAVKWLAYTDQGGLVSADDTCFRIWDPADQCQAVLERPQELCVLQISPCGRFAFGYKSSGGSVRDLERGRYVGNLHHPTAKPSGNVFTPDGQKIAVSTQEGRHSDSVAVRVWQVGVDEPIARFRLPLPYNTLATDGQKLLASSKDRRIRIWELDSPTSPGHAATILCMDTDGRRLVTGSIDKTARVWDLHTGQCVHILAKGDRWVEKVRIHGDYVQTVTDQGTLLWDLERDSSTTQELFPERLSGQGRALSRLNESHCVLWNPRDAEERLVLGPHNPRLTAYEFSPDGRQAVTANKLGNLKIWHTATGQCVTSWQTPATEIEQVSWRDEQLLLIKCADGRHWTWDPVQGTGTRLASEASAAGRFSLTFEGQGKRLGVIDQRTRQRLAEWPGLSRTDQALMYSDTDIVAAQTGGELLFLQLLPPGPVGARPAAPSKAVAKTRAPAARVGKLQLTPLHRLAPYQRVLLVGTGGRSDMLAALPLFEYLRGQKKDVVLAGLISGRKTSPRKRFVEVGPSQRQGALFEQVLADHVQAPVLCFPGGGTLHRLETFRDLVRHTGAEALVLVEAGVETLLRGDEPSLGSAAEDLVSLAAAQQLELPLKMLVNLGLGIDRPKGVCHAYTLEAIADLTAEGGFWGSLSLLPHMVEFQSLQKAARNLGAAAWSDAMVAAAQGKCEGFVTPLLSLLWFFDLDAVARRCQLVPWLNDKITSLDVHRAITNFLTVAQTREWMDLPI